MSSTGCEPSATWGADEASLTDCSVRYSRVLKLSAAIDGFSLDLLPYLNFQVCARGCRSGDLLILREG